MLPYLNTTLYMWTSYCVDSTGRAIMAYLYPLSMAIMWALCNVDAGFRQQGYLIFQMESAHFNFMGRKKLKL
jgi:hypothetical protein